MGSVDSGKLLFLDVQSTCATIYSPMRTATGEVAAVFGSVHRYLKYYGSLVGFRELMVRPLGFRVIICLSYGFPTIMQMTASNVMPYLMRATHIFWNNYAWPEKNHNLSNMQDKMIWLIQELT